MEAIYLLISHNKNKRKAIIVGINEYEDIEIPRLKSAEADAKEIYDKLNQAIPDSVLLCGKQATYARFQNEINKLFDDKDDDKDVYDLILIYFSGILILDNIGQHAWLAACDIKKVNPKEHGMRIGSELEGYISRKKNVEKVILILDCCIIGNQHEQFNTSLKYSWDMFKNDLHEPTDGKVILILHGTNNAEEKESSNHKVNGNNIHNHGILSFHIIKELEMYYKKFDIAIIYKNIKQKMPKTAQEKLSLYPADAFYYTGPDLLQYIENDKWTLNDELGNFSYAYSIYKFLLDQGTNPPLCIGIQAPWGGGKTSIMRMVQHKLDPESQDFKIEDYEQFSKDEYIRKEKATISDIIKNLKNPEKISFNDINGITNEDNRYTVWFNPWMYESTEQIWAGLADSIVNQVSRRLGKKGQLFLFQLHLRRLDAARIRRRIYDRILTKWWHKIYPGISGSIIGIAISLAIAMITPISTDDHTIETLSKYVGIAGGTISIGIGITLSLLQWLNVRNEPAEFSLADYVDVPDYNANLGVIHHIKKDIKRVFQIIGKTKPVIIFIDDLDRCTPGHVANVMEAINLFLAGDIPNCIFIMGMDPGIVATALEYKHKEIMIKNSQYSTNVPLGWRFMDKFVQLPIVVRPPTSTNVNKYLSKLLNRPIGTINQVARNISSNTNRNNDVYTKERVNDSDKAEINTIRVMPTLSFLSSHTYNNDKESLSDKDRSTTQKEIEKEVNKEVEQLSDTDKEFHDQIIRAAIEFSQNPRDLKRFINSLRYHRYLNKTMLGTAKATSTEYFEPTSSQMTDWIILSLKWPEVIRWIYWNSDINTTKERLEILEDISLSCDNKKDCIKQAESRLNLKAEYIHWIGDKELWNFFSKRKDYMKLSIPAGKSFY